MLVNDTQQLVAFRTKSMALEPFDLLMLLVGALLWQFAVVNV